MFSNITHTGLSDTGREQHSQLPASNRSLYLFSCASSFALLLSTEDRREEDDDQLKRWAESRAQGYWLNLSRWQSTSWSPGAPQNLYNWNGPNCQFGNVCGATEADYFKVYDIEVDADSTL